MTDAYCTGDIFLLCWGIDVVEIKIDGRAFPFFQTKLNLPTSSRSVFMKEGQLSMNIGVCLECEYVGKNCSGP